MELGTEIFDGSSEGIMSLVSITTALDWMFSQDTPEPPMQTPVAEIGLAIKNAIAGPARTR